MFSSSGIDPNSKSAGMVVQDVKGMYADLTLPGSFALAKISNYFDSFHGNEMENLKLLIAETHSVQKNDYVLKIE